MNKLASNKARGSRVLFEDVILTLALTAAVLVAWVAGFTSLGGI